MGQYIYLWSEALLFSLPFTVETHLIKQCFTACFLSGRIWKVIVGIPGYRGKKSSLNFFVLTGNQHRN